MKFYRETNNNVVGLIKCGVKSQSITLRISQIILT